MTRPSQLPVLMAFLQHLPVITEFISFPLTPVSGSFILAHGTFWDVFTQATRQGGIHYVGVDLANETQCLEQIRIHWAPFPCGRKHFSFLAKVMPSRYVEIWRFRCCGMINNQQDRGWKWEMGGHWGRSNPRLMKHLIVRKNVTT